MARTTLTATSITKETPVDITSTATTVDAALVTAGAIIAAPLDGRLMLRVTQSDASNHEVYIQSAPEYGYSAGTDGTFFKITQDMAQNEIYAVTLENFKHVRGFGEASANTDNGYIYIDFETGFTGTIEAFAIPK